jgi:hypothetical protein
MDSAGRDSGESSLGMRSLTGQIDAIAGDLRRRARTRILQRITLGVLAVLVFFSLLEAWGRWHWAPLRWLQSIAAWSALVLLLMRTLLVSKRWRVPRDHLLRQIERLVGIEPGWLASVERWQKEASAGEAASAQGGSGSEALKAEAVRRFLDRWPTVSKEQVLKEDLSRRGWWFLIALVGLIGLGWILVPQSFSTAARRVFFPWNAPQWPRRVHLAFRDLPLAVPPSTPVTVRIENQSGPLPEDLKLQWRSASRGAVQTIQWQADGPHALATLPGFEMPIEVRAEGGDDRDMEWHAIQLAAAAKIRQASFTITPPDGIETPPGPDSSQLQLWTQGTRYFWQVEFDRLVDSIHWIDFQWLEDGSVTATQAGDGSLPPVPDLPQPDAVQQQFQWGTADQPLTAERGFRFRLGWRSKEGVESQSEDTWEVRVLPDKAPQLLVVAPEESSEYPWGSRIAWRVQASDDHAIEQWRFGWKAIRGEGNESRTTWVPLVEAGAVVARARAELDWEEGSVVEPSEWPSVLAGALPSVGSPQDADRTGAYWHWEIQSPRWSEKALEEFASWRRSDGSLEIQWWMTASDRRGHSVQSPMRSVVLLGEKGWQLALDRQQQKMLLGIEKTLENLQRLQQATDAWEEVQSSTEPVDSEASTEKLESMAREAIQTSQSLAVGPQSPIGVVKELLQRLAEAAMEESKLVEPWEGWLDQLNQSQQDLTMQAQSQRDLGRQPAAARPEDFPQEAFDTWRSQQEGLKQKLESIRDQISANQQQARSGQVIGQLMRDQETLIDKTRQAAQTLQGSEEIDAARKLSSQQRELASRLQKMVRQQPPERPLAEALAPMQQAGESLQSKRWDEALRQQQEAMQRLAEQASEDQVTSMADAGTTQPSSDDRQAEDESLSASEKLSSLGDALGQLANQQRDLVLQNRRWVSENDAERMEEEGLMVRSRTLADRQQALRQELEPWRETFPSDGSTLGWMLEKTTQQMERAQMAFQRGQLEEPGLRLATDAYAMLETIEQTLNESKAKEKDGASSESPPAEPKESGSPSSEQNDLSGTEESQDNSPVDPLELRLIRAAQRAIVARTEEIDRKSQSGAPLTTSEILTLQELSGQQEELAKLLERWLTQSEAGR